MLRFNTGLLDGQSENVPTVEASKFEGLFHCRVTQLGCPDQDCGYSGVKLGPHLAR